MAAMILSHHILPSNAPPVGSNQYPENPNFMNNDTYAMNAREQSVDSSDDEDNSPPESNARLSIKPRQWHDSTQHNGASNSRKDRHARNNRLRALGQDPSSIFYAKYEDRWTNRKFQRRERIAEAILPEEKMQWQHHLEEEQAKEQQRKRAYLDRERKELVKSGDNAGQIVWSRFLDDAYQVGK